MEITHLFYFNLAAERDGGPLPGQHSQRPPLRRIQGYAEATTTSQQRQVVNGASGSERLLQPQQERHRQVLSFDVA